MSRHVNIGAFEDQLHRKYGLRLVPLEYIEAAMMDAEIMDRMATKICLLLEAKEQHERENKPNRRKNEHGGE